MLTVLQSQGSYGTVNTRLSTGFKGTSSMATQPDASFPDFTPLGDTEKIVLDFIERAAREGRELERSEVIEASLGFASGCGGCRAVMRRLERKGYIKVESFQRGRRVYAVRLDKWTKPPLCVVPHWRTVSAKSQGQTPTLPPQRLYATPTVMEAVQEIMRERACSMQEAQVVLMSYGVSMLATERCILQQKGY